MSHAIGVAYNIGDAREMQEYRYLLTNTNQDFVLQGVSILMAQPGF